MAGRGRPKKAVSLDSCSEVETVRGAESCATTPKTATCSGNSKTSPKEASSSLGMCKPVESKQASSRCSGKGDRGGKKSQDLSKEIKLKQRGQKHIDEEKPAGSAKRVILPEEVQVVACAAPKICAGRSKQSPKETSICKEQKSSRTLRQDPVRRLHSKEESVDRLLEKTLEQLKIRKAQRKEAASSINGIIKNIKDHMKKNTQCFKDINDLRTGSYYENLKISNPDEFDVMMTIPIDRVDLQPFGDDGAFYCVSLKRGEKSLNRFVQKDNTLSAYEMLKEFREEVKKCVKKMKEITEYAGVEIKRKEKGCPAVTLTIKGVVSVPISLDVVLGIEVRTSWPACTMNGFKIDDWLGKKVKQELKRKPYYLVPKYEGSSKTECDGIPAKDVWRISFSHVEKEIVKNHGSVKTCCENGKIRCCRKACLKLLKHLLRLLKEEDSSFNKICSYYAKTTFFHACSLRSKDSDWEASRLSHCFLMLLKDFEDHLRNGKLFNFFIPTQNLLSGPTNRSCTSLAQRIKEERESDFPIFL